jgi:formate C-acetyltransferase
MIYQENKSRWEKMDEVSNRVKKLRDAFLNADPEITIDRARLVTDSYNRTEGQSQCMRRALALKHVLEHMDITINPGELIVGGLTGQLRGVPVFPEYDWGFVLNELDTFEDRIADRFKVNTHTKKDLRNILPKWKGLSLSNIASKRMAEESTKAVKDFVFILTALRSGVGHVVVDYNHVLKKGLKSCVEEIRSMQTALALEHPDYQRQWDYYEASAITCEAVMTLAYRYADLAQQLAEKESDSAIRKELLKISEVCRKVPAEAAGDFHEALQSLWFLHIGIQLESNGHSVSFGRFDQYLYPYYSAEPANKAFAEELIHCFWLKCSEVNKIRDKVASVAFGGYPMFQHITLGGQNAEGGSAVNELTHMCLEATAKVGMHQPSISVRWFANDEDELLLHALKVASYGTGMPAFFNDEVLISNMLQAGYSSSQARDYSIIGCTETSVGGISEPWLTGGFINLLKILELTIFNGYDPVSGDRSSMQTGDVSSFTSFEMFIEAYFKQLSHYLRLHVACDNTLDELHGSLLPNLFASVMIQDCLTNAKSSLEGGARFNSTTINAVGIANVADSLAVIKKFVYEDSALSWSELQAALLDDFEGHEVLRQTFLNQSPKYGNDDDYVDGLAQQVHEFIYEEFKQYRNARGGRYFNALYSIACHVLFADKVGATPDGRKKGTVLADGGISCSQGKDINGPTALLNSVVKLDPEKAVGSTLLNMKFIPSVFDSLDSQTKIASLLKAYFMMKGQHVQLNVIDVETLRDAQKNPDQYASLVVRVAGFSVLFTTIDPLLQEDIILRTETQSGG